MKIIELPKKDNVIITHYGCSDFKSDEHKVFWIGAVYYLNGSKKYFYSDINELNTISDFHDFIKLHKTKTILHWSMNRPNFGFNAIEKRYQELTGKSIKFKISEVDLSEYFKEKYGINYIDRQGGRLNHLAILNNFSGYSSKIEVFKKDEALNRLELLFSIYQAETHGALKINQSNNTIEKDFFYCQIGALFAQGFIKQQLSAYVGQYFFKKKSFPSINMLATYIQKDILKTEKSVRQYIDATLSGNNNKKDFYKNKKLNDNTINYCERNNIKIVEDFKL